MTPSPFSQWQAASTDANFSDPAACAERAGTFERQIKFRNIVEFAAGALSLVLFGGLTVGAMVKGEVYIGLSSALIVIGVLALLWNLRNRASNLERRPEDACLVHLRRQYSRQYKALKSVPRWYLAPLIPGIVSFYAVVTMRVADVIGWAKAIEGIVTPATGTLGLFLAIAVLNWVAARSLKRKIDAIDALA